MAGCLYHSWLLLVYLRSLEAAGCWRRVGKRRGSVVALIPAGTVYRVLFLGRAMPRGQGKTGSLLPTAEKRKQSPNIFFVDSTGPLHADRIRRINPNQKAPCLLPAHSFRLPCSQ